MLPPFQSAFLATRYAAANELQTRFLNSLGAAFGIGIMGVAAVDDDVTRLAKWYQRFNDRIDGRPSLDQQHQLARAFDRLDKFLNGVRAHEVLARCSTLDQGVDFFSGSVENSDFVAAAFYVQGQVLTHHSQTNQTKITVATHHHSKRSWVFG